MRGLKQFKGSFVCIGISFILKTSGLADRVFLLLLNLAWPGVKEAEAAPRGLFLPCTAAVSHTDILLHPCGRWGWRWWWSDSFSPLFFLLTFDILMLRISAGTNTACCVTAAMSVPLSPWLTELRAGNDESAPI